MGAKISALKEKGYLKEEKQGKLGRLLGVNFQQGAAMVATSLQQWKPFAPLELMQKLQNNTNQNYKKDKNFG